VSGDGQLAANRLLGEEGRPHIEPDALKELRRLNSGLVLNNPTRVQRIFAAESVYLGKLGGYDQDERTRLLRKNT
jgi:hypothetical protein